MQQCRIKCRAVYQCVVYDQLPTACLHLLSLPATHCTTPHYKQPHHHKQMSERSARAQLAELQGSLSSKEAAVAKLKQQLQVSEWACDGDLLFRV